MIEFAQFIAVGIFTLFVWWGVFLWALYLIRKLVV